MSAQPGERPADDTVRLFRHIYGDQAGYIGLFSGSRPEPTSKTLTDETSRYYAYPIAAEFAAGWLSTESSGGREAYMCAHLLTAQRRIKDNAAPVQALYVDGDGAKVPPNIPRPTAAVESSPDREHYYWRLARPIESKRAEELNRRLAHAMGADKSGYDLTQLLRPAGTTNHKHGTPTRLLHLDDETAYDPDELERILPPAPARPALAILGRDVALDGDEPPVRLAPEDLAAWTGATFVAQPDGTPDRSRSLFRLGGVLARANASGGAIAAALAERDEALGWRKYTGRADAAARYGEMAAKALADVPESSAVATPTGAGANCARCAPIIADLRRQLEEERRLRRELLAAMAGPEPAEGMQPLPANQRLVRVIADMEHFAAQERVGAKVAPDGANLIRLAVLAKRAGVSTDTASKTLVAAERAGQCTIRRKFDPETGWSEIWYRSAASTLADALAITARQVRPPDPETGKVKPWGGKRQRCPHCGGARLQTICKDCGSIVDEPPEATPQDAVRSSIEATPAHGDADAPEATPNLAAHGDVLPPTPHLAVWPTEAGQPEEAAEAAEPDVPGRWRLPIAELPPTATPLPVEDRWKALHLCVGCGGPLPPGAKYHCVSCAAFAALGGTS